MDNLILFSNAYMEINKGEKYQIMYTYKGYVFIHKDTNDIVFFKMTEALMEDLENDEHKYEIDDAAIKATLTKMIETKESEGEETRV